MTDAQLEWMIRNRKSISPAQRKAAFDAWEAKYGKGKDPNRSTAEVSFGAPESTPADLDPVEAAAAPITPDPMVRKPIGPKPSLTDTMQAANTLASAENFNAAFESNGYDYPTAVAAFTQQLIERGVEPAYAQRAAQARASEHRTGINDEYATQMQASEDPTELYPGYRNAPAKARPASGPSPLPDADPRTTREERLAQHAEWSAGVDQMKERYDRATGLGAPDAIAPDEKGPYHGAGRPGYDRTYTPKEVLAQREGVASGVGRPITETVPGPRGIDGSPVRPGRPIYDEEEAANYTQRPLEAPTGKYRPSQKDRDMAARGMVPVFNPDGSVGYSVQAYPEDDPQTAAREGMPFPGGVGRAGRRQDLLDAGWEAREVDGPTGKQTVYRPGATAQARYDAQADDRTRVRLAKRAGISGTAAMDMEVGDLRKRAKAAGIDDYNERNARWKAQAMLAGGQPTGGPRGTKAVTNALMMMDEDERNSSLRYMLPGGQLAAGVDAANMQAAARLAQNAVTGALAGTAVNPLAQMQMDQMQRDRAIARADTLIAKYPKGWDGMYDAADVQAVRDAVEKQHPGYGDAAVAHMRVRPAAPATPPGGVAPGSVPPL